MALAKSISTFRIVANSTNHDITVQNMRIETVGEDYTDIKTSVGGKKYKNMAGLRDRVRISYDKSVEATEWQAMINDIVTDFVTNDVESIEFYPDNNNLTASDKIDVIPENFDHLVRYTGQVGRFVPDLKLVAVDRKTSISNNFRAP